MRGFFIFAGLLAAIVLLTLVIDPLQSARGKREPISYDAFTHAVRNGQVAKVQITERMMVGLYTDTAVREDDFPGDYDFKVYLPAEGFDTDMRSIAAERTGKLVSEVTVSDYGFIITYEPEPQQSIFMQLLPYLITILVIVGFWFLFMRQMQGSSNKALSFGKSRHRVAENNRKRVTFNEVAGADEEKEELEEIVDFLRNPKKFLELGARIPKGVLLVGPPGTGKTLLAKAVSGEAGVPFFTISGSDFVEMYVGVGASRVRDLFEQAKRNSPCIVFIDEIDAVGRHRGTGLGGGHDEREQTLNQLLVEMDGFSINEGIIILAATNRPDILDPALLRPGRFDRQIVVNYPDVKGREEILKVHARGKPLAAEIQLDRVARLIPLFTGADIENLLNESAILAARRNKKEITMDEINEAIKRVQMGPEKRSRKYTQADRRLVAYHEAGHALVAQKLPGCDPLNEVSIIPRGMAGGYTQTLPDEETQFISRAKLLDRIAMGLGGYVAEELVTGDISTGSSSDLKMVSQLARRMVTEWGMNDEIGPMYLAGEKEFVLGRDIGHTSNFSEQLSAKIDAQVRMIIENARKRAAAILSENRAKLDRVVEALLEKEKLDGEEFARIVNEPQTAQA
ncbi:MAG: ATP-dependent zinc metalloprotease FtsH [Christensenellales bacterium]